MRGRQALRLLLSGAVAGVAWSLLTSVALALVGADFLGAVQAAARYPRADGAFAFAVDLAMGVWATWLYVVLRPRYASAASAASAAGLAWWFLKTLQSAKWVGMGLVPAGLTLAPAAATLVTAVAATWIGAWIHDGVEIADRGTEARRRG